MDFPLNRVGVFVIITIIIMVQGFTVMAYDTYADQQWYLDHIHAPEAWTELQTTTPAVVAVLDTGVDLDHPDLQGNLWKNEKEIPNDGIDNDHNGFVDDYDGWNFVGNSNKVEPNISSTYAPLAVKHGTFVSGIIAAVADNNQGIRGVGPNIKVMPLVVLNSDGSGESGAVARAVDYAVNNGADVINLSFAGDESDDRLKIAIKRAYDHQVVVVAASGNGLMTGVNLAEKKVYPVCYDTQWDINAVIGVAALNRADQLSVFSNYGVCVDISAPGEGFIGLLFQLAGNTDFAEYYGFRYVGTSFSSGLVSGAAALLKTVNKELTTQQILAILKQTSIDISSKNTDKPNGVGGGLLDLQAAVAMVYSEFGSTMNDRIMISADSDWPANVFQFDSNFSRSGEWSVFGKSFSGLNITAADLDHDQSNDIVAGAAVGSESFVRGLTVEGKLLSSFVAFEDKFIGGVRAAAGDVNGDGQIEYAVVPQSNRAPVVRMFNSDGKLLKEFLAFDKKFTKGLTVAVGDVTGDDKAEIVVGAPAGSLPVVKVFDDQGTLLKEITVFDKKFLGGVNITLANVDDTAKLEMAVGSGFGFEPLVKILSYDEKVITSFLAYPAKFHGGVRLAVGDWNGNGTPDIITTPGPTGGPHVKAFDLAGNLEGEFFALPASFTNGIQVIIR